MAWRRGKAAGKEDKDDALGSLYIWNEEIEEEAEEEDQQQQRVDGDGDDCVSELTVSQRGALADAEGEAYDAATSE